MYVQMAKADMRGANPIRDALQRQSGRAWEVYTHIAVKVLPIPSGPGCLRLYYRLPKNVENFLDCKEAGLRVRPIKFNTRGYLGRWSE